VVTQENAFTAMGKCQTGGEKLAPLRPETQGGEGGKDKLERPTLIELQYIS
jgi:hypothetical protein